MTPRQAARGGSPRPRVRPESGAAPPPRAEVRPAGDQAYLIRLGDEISAANHARVFGALAALDAARPAFVVDCVPAYASILVVYDPLAAAPEAVREWIDAALAGASRAAPARRVVTVPVWYDPEVGLDLEDTARLLELAPETVVALHTGTSYLAHMLGFKPGFPYLGTLDERLAAPRLPAPRLAVPAGSVAIAGRQTGIYPVRCPGGWRVLGRTPLRIFAPERPEPFAILPGDEVRFEAIDRERFAGLSAREAARDGGTA